MRYHEFRAMNTTILLAAEGAPPGGGARVVEGFGRVEQQVRAFEQRFTRFSEDSELSALNRAAGGWFEASPELFELVSLACDCYRATDGLFNPAILSALEQVGYDSSMEVVRARQYGERRTPVKKMPPASDFQMVRLDAQRSAIFLPAGLRIDLGGIAKGWIAERAAQLLALYANACVVDAGGDLFTCGLPENESSWSIAIENPFDASKDTQVLSVGPGAVATSTVTKRRWQQGGQERHHLIDPRTGQPAEAFWVSVTVVGEHTAQAEVLAKALLIAGPGELASQLIGRYAGAVFIAVDRNGNLWGSEVLYEHRAKVA